MIPNEAIPLTAPSDLAMVTVCAAVKQFMRDRPDHAERINSLLVVVPPVLESDAEELQRNFAVAPDDWSEELDQVRVFAYLIDRSLAEDEWYITFFDEGESERKMLGSIFSPSFGVHSIDDEIPGNEDLEEMPGSEVERDMERYAAEVFEKFMAGLPRSKVASVIIECGSKMVFDAFYPLAPTEGATYVKVKTVPDMDEEAYRLLALADNGDRIGALAASL